jgi:hypothetical protein
MLPLKKVPANVAVASVGESRLARELVVDLECGDKNPVQVGGLALDLKGDKCPCIAVSLN